jgi:hypothetical protein
MEPKINAMIKPSANGGKEMPNSANSIEKLSRNEYGFTEEMRPIKIPIIDEIIRAENASNAVAGNVSIMVLSTSLLDEYERPRSPWTAFAIKRTYCM